MNDGLFTTFAIVVIIHLPASWSSILILTRGDSNENTRENSQQVPAARMLVVIKALGILSANLFFLVWVLLLLLPA